MTQYDASDLYRRKAFINQLGGGLGAGISSLGGFGLAGGQGEPWRGGQWPYQQPPIRQPQYPSQGPQGGWPYQGGTQMAIHGFGEELGEFGETLGGYGETLGGYGETLGGFEESLGGYEESLGGYGKQLGGFEEKLGGFGEQLSGLGNKFGQQLSGLGDRFGGVNDKLSKIEEGIGSLLQNKGSGRGMNVQPNYGYSPYNMLLNSFFGGYR
jgi:hypothetical protein